jgi:hypothetical protein
MIDLTDKAEPDPEAAQIYEDQRTDVTLQVLYVDEQIVLLRSEETKNKSEDHSHRMLPRTAFDSQVSSERLKLKPDSSVDLLELGSSDWEEVDHIGEKTSKNLKDEGYETVVDVRQANDAELLTVDGLGVAGLDNLRSFAE